MRGKAEIQKRVPESGEGAGLESELGSNEPVLEPKLQKHIDLLVSRYPKLKKIQEDIINAYLVFEQCYVNGGKLLIAGNGGSAADAEHIAGELMKRFVAPRLIPDDLIAELKKVDPVIGGELTKCIEGSLPAIPLTMSDSLSTAYLNDVGGSGIFAQKLYGYGRRGDTLLAISTSGNSENILYAAVMAKALGIKVVGLTGNFGGKLMDVSDVMIRVPETETYKVQEFHLPIYHCLCLMLENKFFN